MWASAGMKDFPAQFHNYFPHISLDRLVQYVLTRAISQLSLHLTNALLSLCYDILKVLNECLLQRQC